MTGGGGVRWLLAVAAGVLCAFGTGGAAAQTVERGPYLQLGTPDGIVVRWRTDVDTDSEVRYGTTQGSLGMSASDATLTTEHEISLAGLTPDTVYYYSVGTTTQVLAGDDADHFFLTSPVPGGVKATRIWVLGDSGSANADAEAVRDAYYGYTGPEHTDLWLMLGDNAYTDGTDLEYQAAVFDMYPEMLRKSVLWPTIGNHDIVDSDAQTGAYFDIFTLPTSAEAGGLASGTEAYYSFDHANVHFICLDSWDTSRSPTGAMMTWLGNDVASTTQDWIVAFWHYPPYSKGAKDSDLSGRSIQMRENALPILEDAGVDLVLTGHSHNYERSFLIDGHYGLSGTFDPSTMLLDGGDGRLDGDGAYGKPTAGLAPHEGAVHVVAGSSGKLASGPLDHPVMFWGAEILGSVVLDVDGNQLDLTFIDDAGVVRDYCTIIKGSGSPPADPSALAANTLSDSAIVVTWTDDSVNETGFEVERSPDGLSGWSQVATTGGGVTGWTDIGLSADTTYWYRVRATNAFGDSGYSNVDSATTGPLSPSGLVATEISPTEIDLAWTDNSANETAFEIERSPDGLTGWTEIGTVAADVVAYSDGGLLPLTTYWYRVRGTNGNGDSGDSNVDSATTLDDAPPAPGGLAAATVSDTRIDLSWTDNSNNETGFEIERSPDGVSGWSLLATVGADVVAHSDTGLTPVTTYWYRVRATNAAGASAYSNVDGATTQDIPPAAPGALGATAISDSRIDLAWTDNSANETGFRIERSPDGLAWAEIAVTGADVTAHPDTGLTSETTYWYRVRATNGAGESAYSSPATATTLLTGPSDLVATAVTDGRIDLSWRDNSSSEIVFRIERSPDGASWSEITIVPADTTTYSDFGLAALTTYFYRVRATGPSADTPYSDTASATTGSSRVTPGVPPESFIGSLREQRGSLPPRWLYRHGWRRGLYR